MSALLFNSEGAKVSLGEVQRDGNRKFYCGRFFGMIALWGPEYYCGPNNGTQCKSCKEYQANYRKESFKFLKQVAAEREIVKLTNDEQAVVQLGNNNGRSKYYCGRKKAIPRSEGRCGPNNGPQCKSCFRLQLRVNEAFERSKHSEPEENNEAKKPEKLICAICMEREKNVVLIPCGHRVCYQCAQRLTKCPMDREDIKDRLRTFD